MQKNKIAQAILDAYKPQAKEWEEIAVTDFSPLNMLSHETGIELACLFSKLNMDCDAMTDWGMKMYEFASLMKDLLVLIGKPGVLEHLHPSNRESASFKLIKLHEFFESIQEQGTTKDWLTWLMLDQFSHRNTDADGEAILRGLHINE